MAAKANAFHTILKDSGIDPAKLPPRSPNWDSYHAERCVKSFKSARLDHLILSSLEQLEQVPRLYGEYYHHERIHLSLGSIIEPKFSTEDTAEITSVERSGGLLKSYQKSAALFLGTGKK